MQFYTKCARHAANDIIGNLGFKDFLHLPGDNGFTGVSIVVSVSHNVGQYSGTLWNLTAGQPPRSRDHVDLLQPRLDIQWYTCLCRPRYSVRFSYRNSWTHFNTLRPRQNGRHFVDSISFSCLQRYAFWFKFPWNVSPRIPFIAWRRSGDLNQWRHSLSTQICISRPSKSQIQIFAKFSIYNIHFGCDFVLHGACSYHFRCECKITERLGYRENIYRQVFNIRRTLVSNKIVDHSDVIGASPVGAAPTISSFPT